jgi:hypothetical protein
MLLGSTTTGTVVFWEIQFRSSHLLPGKQHIGKRFLMAGAYRSRTSQTVTLFHGNVGNDQRYAAGLIPYAVGIALPKIMAENVNYPRNQQLAPLR